MTMMTDRRRDGSTLRIDSPSFMKRSGATAASASASSDDAPPRLSSDGADRRPHGGLEQAQPETLVVYRSAEERASNPEARVRFANRAPCVFTHADDRSIDRSISPRGSTRTRHGHRNGVVSAADGACMCTQLRVTAVSRGGWLAASGSISTGAT